MSPYLIAFNKKTITTKQQNDEKLLITITITNFAKLFAKNKPFPKMEYQRTINTRYATLLKILKSESYFKNPLTPCSHHLPLTAASKGLR